MMFFSRSRVIYMERIVLAARITRNSRVLRSRLSTARFADLRAIARLYLTYVCDPNRWPIIAGAICHMLRDGRAHPHCIDCVIDETIGAERWFPIIPAINMMIDRGCTPPPDSDIPMEARILRGDYIGILCNTNMRALSFEIDPPFPIQPVTARERNIIQKFTIIAAIRSADPRPTMAIRDVAIRDTAIAYPLSGDKQSLRAAVICQSQAYLLSMVNGARSLVDCAREFLGIVSISREDELCAKLPLGILRKSAVKIIDADYEDWHTVLYLRSNVRLVTYVPYMIEHIVDDAKREHVCAVVVIMDRIARYLGVPRDNGDAMLTPRGAAFSAIMSADGFARKTEQNIDIARVTGRLRDYVIVCLWRHVMGICGNSGSASADVIATRNGHLYSYNEVPHVTHIGVWARKKHNIAHRALKLLFLQLEAAESFTDLFAEWTRLLREIAKDERDSEHILGAIAPTCLSADYFENCAHRAEVARAVWFASI